MRKSLFAIVAIAATLGLTAASAFAALSHTLDTTATPSKAGTKKKPKNLIFSAAVAVVRTPPDPENPTAGRFQFSFPKQFKFNNAHFKKCSAAKLNSGGKSACPKGSQIGEGTASATIGPGDVPLEFDTTFFNTGSKTIAIHLQRVQVVNGHRTPLEGSFASPVGKLTKASGKYASKLTVTIPPTVKKTAAGYSKLIKLDFKMDKKYKGQTFIRSIGCKGGKYSIKSQLFYESNPNPPSVSSSTKGDTAKCKK